MNNEIKLKQSQELLEGSLKLLAFYIDEFGSMSLTKHGEQPLDANILWNNIRDFLKNE